MAALPRKSADLASIVSAIERSPIMVIGHVTRPAARHYDLRDLPAGYEPADILVLDWIAAEALRARRNYLPL
ncbi:MAG: hypothetical protein WBD11_02300 [Xanthobacteraceae bacterium]|jgi:hypothetical protein